MFLQAYLLLSAGDNSQTAAADGRDVGFRKDSQINGKETGSNADI